MILGNGTNRNLCKQGELKVFTTARIVFKIIEDNTGRGFLDFECARSKQNLNSMGTRKSVEKFLRQSGKNMPDWFFRPRFSPYFLKRSEWVPVRIKVILFSSGFMAYIKSQSGFI